VTLRERTEDAFAGKIPLPPICLTLGMRFADYGEGRASLKIPVDERFHNPMGTVHGGIMTDVADAAMGIAVVSTLEGDETFTTLELNMNFLRPVFSGELTATGKVVKRGKKIAYVEVEVTASDGKLVAKGNSTCMILAGNGRG
jgi:uncharacterized protein (TIGR00369 family)